MANKETVSEGGLKGIDERLSDQDLAWVYNASGPASFGATGWQRSSDKRSMTVRYKPGTDKAVANRHLGRIEELLDFKEQDLG